VAGDRVVALFNVAGEFFALDGVCPHQGGPLGQGILEGETVTCPWHGWQFNVCSGQCRLSPSVAQPTIPLRIEEEAVFVQV
jgi:nitrite reductase/ring-hydroxylating ferredoxin subunit